MCNILQVGNHTYGATFTDNLRAQGHRVYLVADRTTEGLEPDYESDFRSYDGAPLLSHVYAIMEYAKETWEGAPVDALITDINIEVPKAPFVDTWPGMSNVVYRANFKVPVSYLGALCGQHTYFPNKTTYFCSITPERRRVTVTVNRIVQAALRTLLEEADKELYETYGVQTYLHVENNAAARVYSSLKMLDKKS